MPVAPIEFKARDLGQLWPSESLRNEPNAGPDNLQQSRLSDLRVATETVRQKRLRKRHHRQSFSAELFLKLFDSPHDDPEVLAAIAIAH